LRINPDYADARRNLEIALAQTGNRKEPGNRLPHVEPAPTSSQQTKQPGDEQAE